MNTPTPSPWLFIEQNMNTIDKLVFSQVRNSKDLDPEDFKHDVIVYIAERVHTYNPKRSGPSTWIFWQVKAVLKLHLNRFKKRPEQLETEIENSYCSEDRIHKRLTVIQIFEYASEPEANAMKTIMTGLKVSELPQKAGFTAMTRSRRMKAFKERLHDAGVL